MKKFSTAALLLVLAGAASAQSASTEATSNRCAFLPNAPDQHKVVRGDTLWDISGKFLQHAWCWPQVWGLNRDEIRNPHLIYPGQIVYFDRTAGRLRLGNPAAGNSGAAPTVRLSPQVRTEGLAQHAIPSIPSSAIEPFLSQPLIVTEDELKTAPRIMATEGNRVVLGKNDKAYVRGDLQSGTSFQVFRPATPIRDPGSKEIIGHEAAYLGTIKLERAATAADEVHVFRVVTVKQEMSIGDRLLPMPPTPILNYVPHAPEREVDARIASVYGGVSQAGQNQIVTINRGTADGVDLGTVLDLYRFGGMVPDPTEKSGFLSRKTMVRLPDSKYGSLFIFRAFDKISYGLVMQVTDTVQVGDLARAPQ